MTCLLCQHALTSRTGKFLASNLERHLRTKHANSDTYREFQRDKDQWTEECGRVRISHIISLPNTKYALLHLTRVSLDVGSETGLPLSEDLELRLKTKRKERRDVELRYESLRSVTA